MDKENKASGGCGGAGRIGNGARKASGSTDATAQRPTFHPTQPNNTSGGCGGAGRIGSGVRRTSSGKTKGFMGLDVYKDSYEAMLTVYKKILPILPKGERFDLYDQLRRSTKAVPRLIAEGHSKRHQNKGFQKYIDDAHAESNETIVSISQVRDLYAPPNLIELCDKLIDIYDKTSRGLYNLAVSWEDFHKRSKYRRRPTPDVSPDATS